ncbi:MAG: hypothetical protein ACREHE_04295 [Rhizomicrobium sp.]
MALKTLMIAAAAAATLAVAIVCPASAGGIHGGMMSGTGYGAAPKCKTGGVSIYKPVTINKNISIYKPVTITKNIDNSKNISIYKPVTIEKNIDITKNIDNSKNININKNVNINKNININKVIVINKGGANAEAQAFAEANASANANAQASSVSYSAAYSESTVINHNGGGGEVAVAAEETCQMQDATVVKAIHVVCVAEGREFAASHMVKDTWIESGYEGEVARCIPGAHIKAVIGDVVQSDEGMAGTYANGQVLECGMHEALRHYKDGMLKCAPAVPVKDCTERTNLRLYGTGDFFFSYRTQVCATLARKGSGSIEVTGMALDGGVGDGGN